MFERFTDRARRVVVLAQDESRQLGHNYIGTEHLLLGLLGEPDGHAGRALTEVGISLEDARRAVEETVGRGSEQPMGHIPFTPRAKKVLELALRQALQLGHNYIGTEHILLGLLQEGEGVAAHVLRKKVEGGLEGVREQVIKLLDLTPGVAERLHVRGALSQIAVDDEIRKRLEAIEARLSAIEQLLREQRGEEEVS